MQKKNNIIILFLLLSVQNVVSQFYLYNNCAVDNNGKGWDQCNCDGAACISCKDEENYRLVFEYYGKQYTHCCHNLCATCQNPANADECFTCIEGYYIDSEGVCQPCMEGCKQCKSKDSCDICEQNTDYNDPDFIPGKIYIFDNQQQKCVIEDCPDNCYYCALEKSSSSYKKKCKVCDMQWDGENQLYISYQFNFHGDCVQCPQDCQFCETQKSNILNLQCRQCANSHVINYFDDDDYQDTDQNFSDIYVIYGVYSEQIDYKYAYYLNQDSVCVPCPTNCLDCELNGDIECVSCVNGKYLTEQKTCEECDKNCNHCIFNNELKITQCTECSALNYYIDKNGICKECPANCKSCSISLDHTTIECDSCISKNQEPDNHCCPIGCETCTAKDNGEVMCLKCTDARRFNSPENNCKDDSDMYKYFQQQGKLNQNSELSDVIQDEIKNDSRYDDIAINTGLVISVFSKNSQNWDNDKNYDKDFVVLQTNNDLIDFENSN
ncbi:Insulin-like growth factor binding protein, N-terminal [Pseudocohnilembus persalinus]|uniref:Insulin-like growth factor binding protein, N-terminal n=1 Tax=Pseudocohnilembus persalinus TaxID=266149 RepID=A0A0V0R0W1_PSEPJ|nr:Insulin-like growth factor binding protein, N-terminal [Pseudocohnilembus persalinus]|eukprot:KRX07936.1 Insulin-like growth factor binding protein, N-terminal [Pseudocohnilembus persalinus]